ncbi:hypothetical protein [Streptomyces sp. NBC_01197]|uniref:hypothetical protein n=1 Tax=Streptomyces sp. NBC_01197 TaxID=2903768 RepID=UPI002E0F33B7|nr:hypothetical protein OG452_35140 [Streptomyces sp. NBC_01197]
MSEHVGPEVVEQLIQAVSRLYAKQIMAERRAAQPDSERMEKLKAKVAACAADQEALSGADEREMTDLATRYAALRKELGGS